MILENGVEIVDSLWIPTGFICIKDIKYNKFRLIDLREKQATEIEVPIGTDYTIPFMPFANRIKP